MHLYVTRHGKTEYNDQNRYTGSTDISLNAEGTAQAEALADTLKDRQFDVIVSSTLKRAAETADIAARFHINTPRLKMSEFNERNIGVFEGLTREEAASQYADLWNSRCTSQLDGAPTGGETIREVDDRVKLGLIKLKELYPDGSVLLVCHAYVARLINRQVKKLDFKEMNDFVLQNCCVAEYKIN